MPIQSVMPVREIDKYTTFQRIKQASKEENPVLDYEIAVSKAKLETMGVNVEDLTLV